MATPKSTRTSIRRGPQRVCVQCFSPFIPWPSGPGKFCSVKCRNDANKVPPEERFWRHVLKTDTCWIWTAGRLTRGYGSIRIGGRSETTHRLSWELHFGPIPAGLSVLHNCDNPPCVRPEHLFLGTDADNVRDMFSKGRQAIREGRRGETNNKAKLTTTQVIEIRRQYDAGIITQRDLATNFTVCLDTIRKIVHRIYWTHI